MEHKRETVRHEYGEIVKFLLTQIFFPFVVSSRCKKREGPDEYEKKRKKQTKKNPYLYYMHTHTQTVLTQSSKFHLNHHI